MTPAVPPHDLDAERALIGAAVLDTEVMTRVGVRSGDFYLPRHETMWRVLAGLNGAHPDRARGLLDRLIETGDFRAGHLDGPYIAECVQACITPAGAPQYALVVRRAARRRRIIEALTRGLQLVTGATDDDVDAPGYEAMAGLEAVLGDATGGTRRGGLRDLTWLRTTGKAPPVDPPAWCRRTDGTALFYAGRVNGVFGDPESAKSWLAQLAIVETLAAGRRAALVDVDHNGEALTVERLLLLGARPDVLADPDRFRYLEPDDELELRAAVHDLVQWSPQVAVLDSIGEMFPMLGVKSVDNDEATLALRTIASPLARAGTCVVTVDHLPKASDARSSGFAIGATAKKRAIDGALIQAEARTQPAPGQTGRVTLRVEKDRPGRLRATCSGKYAGTFIIDSTVPHVTTATIEPGGPITKDGVFRPTHLMEIVSMHVEDHPGASRNQIEKGVHGNTDAKRAAIDRLIEEGYVTTLPGIRGATAHHSLAVYREADDDQA